MKKKFVRIRNGFEDDYDNLNLSPFNAINKLLKYRNISWKVSNGEIS